MAQKPVETDDSVKLKPIMGIRPGIYLTVLYSFILLIFLFWLFVYHGLVNYGTVLEIKTEPEGAAVRVNDVYLGTSGTRIPMPNSIKPMEPVNITIVLPGFEMRSMTHQIPGRVFGSRFFPHRYKIEYTLHTNDTIAVLTEAASEFADWTFGGEPTGDWQVPLVLSETAYRIGPFCIEDREKKAQDILLAASRFAVTRAALRDLVRAKFLLDNGGNAPSPVSVLNSMGNILGFLSDNEGTAEWLVSLLPPETSSVVRNSEWFKHEQTAKEMLSKLAPVIPQGFGTRRLSIVGLSFTGNANLLISETHVSKTLFETFLTAHPEWSEQYVVYFETDGSFATGMSMYAAEAFCKWLTDSLPASMVNMEARLPTGDEWSLAYEYGLILSGTWEWTQDPFAPLNFTANNRAIQSVGSPERTIFTGVSYNQPLTKASLPPDFCSPVVSFRPVIAPRNGE